MVSLAYCKVKNISAIQTAPLTLMATVHPKKPSLPGRFFHIWMYVEGYLRNARISSSRNLPSMTPKEASTTKARKTSAKSTANPQAVATVTSDEKNASIEAGIRCVIPKASRPFLSGFMPSTTTRLPMTIILHRR